MDQGAWVFIIARTQDLAKEFQVLIQQGDGAEGLGFMGSITGFGNHRNVHSQGVRRRLCSLLHAIEVVHQVGEQEGRKFTLLESYGPLLS